MTDVREQYTLVSPLLDARDRMARAEAGWFDARREQERAVIAVALAEVARFAPSAESLVLEESDQGDFYMVVAVEGPGRRWTRETLMKEDTIEDLMMSLSSQHGEWLTMLSTNDERSPTSRRLHLEDAVLFAAGAEAVQLRMARQYGMSQTVEIDAVPLELPEVVECTATNTTSGSGDVHVQAYMFANSHSALGRPVLWVDRTNLEHLVGDGVGDPADVLSAGGNAGSFIDLSSEPPVTVDEVERTRVEFEVRVVGSTKVYGLHDWEGLDVVDAASIREVSVVAHTMVRRTSIEGVSTSPSVPGVGMYDPAGHVHTLQR